MQAGHGVVGVFQAEAGAGAGAGTGGLAGTATLTGAQVAERPLVITNTGSEAVQAVVTTVASPKLPLPAGGDGFAIERTYYNMDGTEANVTQANQNDRFVVVLNVTENNAWPSRVLVRASITSRSPSMANRVSSSSILPEPMPMPSRNW